jgi:hypothetical protein
MTSVGYPDRKKLFQKALPAPVYESARHKAMIFTRMP